MGTVSPPVPVDEEQRLGMLRALEILDTPPERTYQEIVELAATICDAPIAVISFVDEHRVWCKAEVGFEQRESSRETSFTAYAIVEPITLVVADAATDERFATNPYVLDSSLRFYAGVPLRVGTTEGSAVGALCVCDHWPRELSSTQLAALNSLGHQVEQLLALRITVRESANRHERLLASTGHFRQVLQSLAHGVVVFSRTGGIEHANPAAERILGLASESIRGRAAGDERWPTFQADGTPFPPGRYPAIVTMRTGEPVRDVIMGVDRPDGIRRWLLINTVLLEGSDATVVATFSDITEFRALNLRLQDSLDQLTAAYREKAALTSAVSHDLKAPLAAIRIMSEVLDDRGEDLGEEQRRNLARRVRLEVQRTEGVLSDLVAVDKLGAGLITPRRQLVDLGRLILRVVQDQSTTESHRVRVGQLDGDLTVFVDQAQVERIIDNLVSNALKHTPPGTAITLDARGVGGNVDLLIDDEGPGIGDSLKERVFEPYVRGDQLSTRPGSGIGLYLVRQFAQFHSGTAWCEDAPTGGARFVVRFPQDTRSMK